MHVLTVAYGQPSDPAAFDEYYRSTHISLAEKIPGLVELTARSCESLDGAPAPYHLLAQLAFASGEALQAGLQSDEGQSAAADVANFADGGVTMFVQVDTG